MIFFVSGNYTYKKNKKIIKKCDPKIDIFKSCNFVSSKHAGFENLLRLCLSLTFSEVMDNLRFQGHVTLRGHVT